MKVYIDEDELWPDFNNYEPCGPDETYLPFQERYVAELPEELWTKYLEARTAYMDLKDQIDDLLNEQGFGNR